MIKQLVDFPDDVLAFVCNGRVTKEDYDAVLVPAVMNGLKRQGKDLTRWERVAVVTDVEWIKHAVRFFSFLMPGVTKFFSRSEAAQAREWIIAD